MGKEDQDGVDKGATPVSSDAELLPMLSDQEHPQTSISSESPTEPEEMDGNGLSFAFLKNMDYGSREKAGIENSLGSQNL